MSDWNRKCRTPQPCIFFSGGICEYLLIKGHRRPCGPGDACTVKETAATRQKNERQETMDRTIAKLYAQGFSDPAIAEKVNVGRGVIRRWRVRRGLSPNHRGGRPRKIRREEGEE